FIAMGGEASIIGPTSDTDGIINIGSTSPMKFKRALAGRDLTKMRWFVVSKSGSTKETRKNSAYLEKLYQSKGLDPREYIIYVSDHGSALRDEKSKAGFVTMSRELNDQTSIGGRNTLMNWPTLLAYAWRMKHEPSGIVRQMIEHVVAAHAPPKGNQADLWIQ